MSKPTCAEPPGPEPHVPELLIQRLWEQLGFPRDELTTTTGADLQIQHPGTLQSDAGPDFTGARVTVNNLTWHGEVEIHRYSSDWYKHGHHEDSRFNSVILHVSLYRDTQTGNLARKDGTILPELVLAPLLSESVWRFMRSGDSLNESLPCQHLWSGVAKARRNKWLQELGKERIQDKASGLDGEYLSAPDLEHLLYVKLFRGLGYSKNADSMERLAGLVPLEAARSVRNQIDREALYLGTADLLPAASDVSEGDTQAMHYLYNARNSFRGLQLEHKLTTMEAPEWTFFRLRPANFPTLRVAQSAALFDDKGLLRNAPIARLREALKESNPQREIRSLLEASPSSFWDHHVRFAKPASKTNPSLGRSRKNTLIENAVAPVMLIDAEQRSDVQQREAALSLLSGLPGSSDRIVRIFEQTGVRASDGLITQGLHQLYRTRCKKSLCFNCMIGQQVLQHR